MQKAHLFNLEIVWEKNSKSVAVRTSHLFWIKGQIRHFFMCNVQSVLKKSFVN